MQAEQRFFSIETAVAKELDFPTVENQLLTILASERGQAVGRDDVILKGWQYPFQDAAEGRPRTVVTVQFKLWEQHNGECCKVSC